MKAKFRRVRLWLATLAALAALIVVVAAAFGVTDAIGLSLSGKDDFGTESLWPIFKNLSAFLVAGYLVGCLILWVNPVPRDIWMNWNNWESERWVSGARLSEVSPPIVKRGKTSIDTGHGDEKIQVPYRVISDRELANLLAAEQEGFRRGRAYTNRRKKQSEEVASTDQVTASQNTP